MKIDLSMYKWKKLKSKSDSLSKQREKLMIKIGEINRQQDHLIKEMNIISVNLGSDFKLKDIYP